MALGCARERARGEEEGEGECERGRGGVATRGIVQSDEGGGAPGKQGGWWRGAVARARAGHAPLPLSRTKTTEEEAGWAACWLGRPAAAGLHRGEPQVSFPVLSPFSIFF